MTLHAGIFGLYYVYQSAHVPVSLLDVNATAQIVDLSSAQVRLKQRYQLPSTAPHALNASYTFPIPARAVVSSFVLVKQDTSRVVGVVQEKAVAQQTYDAAVQSGKLASLMVHDSPDVFTVSVGNILPGEIVTIELVYATELTEDEENDQVRFHLPANVGARYGTSPVAAAAASATTSSTFFHFSASIESPTPIAKIGCPSHAVETYLGPDPTLPNAAALPFSNHARLAFASPKDLSTDIILTVKSAGLDSPRCIAEVHPDPSHKTVALSLTLVPRFNLPDVARQEFVFLVDRSGSMSGSRMETAKKALVVLLRSLPASGTEFNIWSFGDRTEPLWPHGSRQYNQATLDEATKAVDAMSANFGGTQIRSALDSVFRVRKSDRPTSVFVLTDGDAWDLDGVLETVKTAVSTTASPGAYLRAFTLGIGDSSSTAMVEGIARVGNGVAAFVSDGESFTGKSARLLKAARAPLISNIRLEWVGGRTAKTDEKDVDDGFELLSVGDSDSEHTVSQPEKAPISLFDEDVDPLAGTQTSLPPVYSIVLPAPAPCQQSPHRIRGLSPANRLYVYSILTAPLYDGTSTSIPTSVVLTGELHSGEKVALEVPVTLSQPGSTPLHTLAARKLIQDLEDGQHDFATAGNDIHSINETVKASIVRLGKTYSIASAHTSFVAVDESEGERARSRKCENASWTPFVEMHEACRPKLTGARMAPTTAYSLSAPGAPSSGLALASNDDRRRSQASTATSMPPPPAARSGRGGGFSSFDASSPSMGASFKRTSRQAAPASSPHADRNHASSQSTRFLFGGSIFGARAPAASASTSTFGGAVSYSVPPVPAPQVAPSPSSPSLFSRKKTSMASSAIQVAQPFAPALTSVDRLDRLARLQAFDGSFAIEAAVLCGADLPKVAATLALGLAKDQLDRLAATIVAMRFMETQLKDIKDAWEAIFGKARDFCVGVLGGESELVVALDKVRVAAF